jgi:PHD/YefM family antitoxin component YafN of YafNO toxin-antitoxin module
MKTTNASNARKTLARLLESVIDDEQPIVIVRYREPQAAIVPISRLHPAERALLKSKLGSHGGLGGDTADEPPRTVQASGASG